MAGPRQASSGSPLPAPTSPSRSGTDYAGYPGHVAKAVEILLEAGVSGPYGLCPRPAGVHGRRRDDRARRPRRLRPPAPDPRRSDRLGPWRRRRRVLSLRGGDFLFESGEDLCLGYSHHDADSVHLYLEESFSFRVATPEAAVALSSGKLVAP